METSGNYGWTLTTAFPTAAMQATSSVATTLLWLQESDGGDEGDPSLGVREPRRPGPERPSGAVALEVPV